MKSWTVLSIYLCLFMYLEQLQNWTKWSLLFFFFYRFMLRRVEPKNTETEVQKIDKTKKTKSKKKIAF